eukprot:scpid9252/ scgid19987/ 
MSRKSTRTTRGRAPDRLGEWLESTQTDAQLAFDAAVNLSLPPSPSASVHDVLSLKSIGVDSISVTSSRSARSRGARSAHLRAEYEAAKKLAELEQQQIESQRRLLQIELAMQHEAIDSQHDSSSTSSSAYSGSRRSTRASISSSSSVRGQPAQQSVRGGTRQAAVAVSAGGGHAATANQPPATSTATVRSPAVRQQQAPQSDATQQPQSDIAQLAGAILAAVGTQKPSDTPAQRHMKGYMARQAAGKDLPQFAGQPEEWPIFKKMFDTTTRDCGFSHAENLSRLHRALKGKARDAVQFMLAVPDNVPEILATLQERFGRPEHVVHHLITRAQSFRTLRADDFEQLVEFSTAVRGLVQTMKLMNSTGHLRNPQLRQELVAKLPAGMRLNWGEMIANFDPEKLSLDDFSVWLCGKASAASRVTVLKTGSVSSSGG